MPDAAHQHRLVVEGRRRLVHGLPFTPTVAGSPACVQGFQDDDDNFRSADVAAALCIPDVPDSLNTESDSIDLDDVPCVVPSLDGSLDTSAADDAAGEQREGSRVEANSRSEQHSGRRSGGGQHALGPLCSLVDREGASGHILNMSLPLNSGGHAVERQLSSGDRGISAVLDHADGRSGGAEAAHSRCVFKKTAKFTVLWLHSLFVSTRHEGPN